jgi:hypothetical protein
MRAWLCTQLPCPLVAAAAAPHAGVCAAGAFSSTTALALAAPSFSGAGAATAATAVLIENQTAYACSLLMRVPPLTVPSLPVVLTASPAIGADGHTAGSSPLRSARRNCCLTSFARGRRLLCLGRGPLWLGTAMRGAPVSAAAQAARARAARGRIAPLSAVLFVLPPLPPLGMPWAWEPLLLILWLLLPRRLSALLHSSLVGSPSSTG